jgi:hypothetical protein
MHGVDQHEAFLDAAFLQAFIHLRGDVDEGSAARHLKPELFAIAFHFSPFIFRDNS